MAKSKIKRENQTGSWFCWSTNKLDLAEEQKLIVRDFREWGWIKHLPDSEDGKEHIHFLINTNGTRTIQQIANKVNIPSNFIQICYSVVGHKRYFIHLDNPEKQQYSFDDIHTNNHRSYRDAIEGTIETDDLSLFQDFINVSRGFTTPENFITSHYREFQHLGFYQKIKIFQILDSASLRGIT